MLLGSDWFRRTLVIVFNISRGIQNLNCLAQLPFFLVTNPKDFAWYLVDRASSLNILYKLRIKLAFSSGSHYSCKGLWWYPLGWCSWSRLFHHAINLFEGQSLSFGNEEPGVNKGGGTQPTPNEEDARFKISLIFTDHVRCDDSDDGIPEPVGGSR